MKTPPYYSFLNKYFLRRFAVTSHSYIFSIYQYWYKILNSEIKSCRFLFFSHGTYCIVLMTYLHFACPFSHNMLSDSLRKHLCSFHVFPQRLHVINSHSSQWSFGLKVRPSVDTSKRRSKANKLVILIYCCVNHTRVQTKEKEKDNELIDLTNYEKSWKEKRFEWLKVCCSIGGWKSQTLLCSLWLSQTTECT